MLYSLYVSENNVLDVGVDVDVLDVDVLDVGVESQLIFSVSHSVHLVFSLKKLNN